jgi:hypothetical protein
MQHAFQRLSCAHRDGGFLDNDLWSVRQTGNAPGAQFNEFQISRLSRAQAVCLGWGIDRNKNHLRILNRLINGG